MNFKLFELDDPWWLIKIQNYGWLICVALWYYWNSFMYKFLHQSPDTRCKYMLYHLQVSKDWTECKSDFCKSFWHVLFPLYYCMLMTAFRITQNILDHIKTLNFFASQIFESHRSKSSTMHIDIYTNEKKYFFMYVMSINWKNHVFRK